MKMSLRNRCESGKCLGVITDDSVITLEEAVALAKEYEAKSMVSKDDLIPKNA